MRELGIKDRGYGKAEILQVLAQNRIDTIVIQPGYLADQPAMAAFESMLSENTLYHKVRAIPMRGKLDKPEKELVIYSKAAAIN